MSRRHARTSQAPPVSQRGVTARLCSAQGASLRSRRDGGAGCSRSASTKLTRGLCCCRWKVLLQRRQRHPARWNNQPLQGFGVFLLQAFQPAAACQGGLQQRHWKRHPSTKLLQVERSAADLQRCIASPSPMLVQVAYNPGVMLPYSKLGEEHEVTVQDASQLAAKGEVLSYWELMVSLAALVSGQSMAPLQAQPIASHCCWQLCRPSMWHGHQFPVKCPATWCRSPAVLPPCDPGPGGCHLTHDCCCAGSC